MSSKKEEKKEKIITEFDFFFVLICKTGIF